MRMMVFLCLLTSFGVLSRRNEKNKARMLKEQNEARMLMENGHEFATWILSNHTALRSVLNSRPAAEILKKNPLYLYGQAQDMDIEMDLMTKNPILKNTEKMTLEEEQRMAETIANPMFQAMIWAEVQETTLDIAEQFLQMLAKELD